MKVKKTLLLVNLFLFFALFLFVKKTFSQYYGCNTNCNPPTTGCTAPLICFQTGIYTTTQFCRNPDCPTEPGCICPTPTNNPLTPTSTPTPTPTAAPTPTPTPVPRWVKLKNTSFIAQNDLVMPIPPAVLPYDGTDDGGRYFIISTPVNYDPGLAFAKSIISLNIPNPSVKKWQGTSADRNVPMSPSDFLNYVKARKQYTTITSISDITGSGMYVYNGDVAVVDDEAPFNQPYNIVLVVTGTVEVGRIAPVTTFIPGGSVAIIAPTIKFYMNSTEAHGIFIANNIDTGANNNQGLKIVGNFIALNNLRNERQWPGNLRPSMFIIFDQSYYINLLPYLSTSSYQWSQTQ